MKPQTNIRNFTLLMLVAFCVAHARITDAQSLVTNGSFENTGGTFVDEGGGAMTSLSPGSTVIPGWAVTNDEIAWLMNGNVTGIATPFGCLLLDRPGTHDDNVYGGVTQTISTTPSQTYTLSLSIGAVPFGNLLVVMKPQSLETLILSGNPTVPA